MSFDWPLSRAHIASIHSARKRVAVENAMRTPFYAERLKGLDLDRLDDPEVWTRILLLTKDELRQLSSDAFYSGFCIDPRSQVVEYWRSGGVTGRPIFYPRSAGDMRFGLLSFRRAWALIGATPADCAHISFPLGIHPVGHLYARTAEDLGIGTIWCGAGASTPSMVQLDLIQELRPTIWAGMASYGLHLANLAEGAGIDLRNSSVKKLIVAAEPLSPAKREKLERAWGAEVFDHFGMTEGGFVAGECSTHDGLYVWTDLYHVEVVDERGMPLPDGEVGSLVITPLFTNSITPFLRWSSGDLVRMMPQGTSDGPWSVFPVMRHERRTVAFFKVRGINIGHPELEDLMFSNLAVGDFKAEVLAAESGLDVLRLSIEPSRGRDPRQAIDSVRAEVARRFEITPEVVALDPGTIGKEFETSVKAARFLDKRG
jgi:phenylacetate-CoA ligase